MRERAGRILGALLALLAAIALVVAGVVLLTGGDDVAPVMIVAPKPTSAPVDSSPRIRVHVSGAVRSPGVYEMSDGDRVMDAIAAAGGVQQGADLALMNLARRVQDEAQYHVPVLSESPTESTGDSSFTQAASPENRPLTQGGQASPSLIDLNTATAQELETLPGIGPVMAGRIVTHRDTNGPFASVDDIQNVPGIGPKTLESIRPLVTVGSGR